MSHIFVPCKKNNNEIEFPGLQTSCGDKDFYSLSTANPMQ